MTPHSDEPAREGAEALDLHRELQEVLAGLAMDPPRLSPRWLYDAVGSALFEAITRLAVYRITRSELVLLTDLGPEIAQALPAEATVVELGIGSPAKARLLLAAMDRPRRFIGVDVSSVALAAAVRGLSDAFPGLAVDGWGLDFTQPAELRRQFDLLVPKGPLVVFFPGSTLGNFDPAESKAFLAGIAECVPAGTPLVLGADLVKPAARLELAYDDPAGTTAAFNRNALVHLNARFNGTFDPRAWRHEARWRPALRRVEMWLVAVGDQRVRLGDTELFFADGTGIHTESSHKFDRDHLTSLAQASGWQIEAWWEDEDAAFAEVLLVRGHEAPPVGRRTSL